MGYDSNTWDNSNVVPIRKLAIAIDLDQLEQLVQEYLREHGDEDYDLHHQILFSHFLQWATQRQETTDET